MSKRQKSSSRRYPDDVAWIVAMNGSFWAVWPSGHKARLGRCKDPADWADRIGPWLRVTGRKDVITRNDTIDGTTGWGLVRNSADKPNVSHISLTRLQQELCCDENHDGITLENARRNSIEVLIDESRMMENRRRGHGKGDERGGGVRGDPKAGR